MTILSVTGLAQLGHLISFSLFSQQAGKFPVVLLKVYTD
ncbi:hypothetical protein B4144_0834 [Bacillus atrophaeus]|nr:hypothetical protein B4144_0834 [Bacillus atrophaeus]